MRTLIPGWLYISINMNNLNNMNNLIQNSYKTIPKLSKQAVQFLTQSDGLVFQLIGLILFLIFLNIGLIVHLLEIRFHRDLGRLILKDRLDILDSARLSVATAEKTLQMVESAPEPLHNRPYLVLSLTERRVWYKQDGIVLFTAPVATGSGKELDKEGGGTWKFETPRGRLIIQSKDENPVWVPPDWHYVEEAQKLNLSLVFLEQGQSLTVSDGSTITTTENDVIRIYPDGRQEIMKATEGDNIVVDGKLLVPPLGTTQRRYEGVLGYYRLNLGDGYAMHGTNDPNSVGNAVSHGCIRLLNEDMAKLYSMVTIGTPVYIY